MKIDLSVPVTRKMVEEMKALVPQNKILSELDLFGHLGTHFDIVEKTFDMANLERRGRVFDVRDAEGEVGADDLNLSELREGDFAMFHTGTLKRKGYGTKDYLTSHPELSWDLIKRLVRSKVSMIGVDTAGIRMIAEHPRADRYCAENGAFVVENLDNLDVLLEKAGGNAFTVWTYPMNFSGATGLPCRVIARVD
ncbi:MAG: cyclase family protein [Synergistaceae bacterium]|jgi:kynurenine formamidase|nr:cyclase family protein [Synergistaceae bacterium]